VRIELTEGAGVQRIMEGAAGLLANGVAAKHRRAANRHSMDAERHMEQAIHWRDSGDHQLAVIEVREAMLKRQLAHVELARAQHVERSRTDPAEVAA
jgi:hypothetical protein